MKFSIGTDPEFMIMNKNQFVSAIGIVPGTKTKQKRIGECSYYYDNVLAECTVKPSYSEEEWIANLKEMIENYAKLIYPNKLITRAFHEFDKKQLNHKDAFAVGCDPEYCAYSLREIDPSATQKLFKASGRRSAGGHIHIGSEFAKTGRGCIFTIRMLDLFLGIPSLFIDHDPTSKLRKELYGKAGRYRQPKYGAEYRSVSNFWLSSPKIASLVFKICEFTNNFVTNKEYEKYWTIDEKRLADDNAWNEDDFDPAKCYTCFGYDLKLLRSCIDNNSKDKASSLMSFIKTIVPSKIFSEIERLSKYKEYDLYAEWGIKC